MSTRQNTDILENALADFDGLIKVREYPAAKLIINYLLEEGFSKEAMQLSAKLSEAQQTFDTPTLAGLQYVPITVDMEEQYQERRAKNLEFLREKGRTEGDVMSDEAGAYIYVEYEEGPTKVYLPYANEIDMVF